MKKYLVLMLPSRMPLQWEWQTLEQAERAIDWQVSGSNKREDFILCEGRQGKLFSVNKGEEVTPTRGIFTDAAWAKLEELISST